MSPASSLDDAGEGADPEFVSASLAAISSASSPYSGAAGERRRQTSASCLLAVTSLNGRTTIPVPRRASIGAALVGNSVTPIPAATIWQIVARLVPPLLTSRAPTP